MSDYSYLKPKVKSPLFIRSQKNGMFINPPPYMENWGGFTSAGKLERTGLHNMMELEKKPTARGSKPF